MRKNKAMRAAGGMLIATLLSTSIVSGTYAKYVTEDSGSDTARVAKFGVVVTADGDLFSDTYKTTANTPGVSADNKADAASLSVVSAAYASGNGVDGTDHVVAPGTKNTDGLTFTVTGKPEVAVKVEFAIADGSSDIWLGAGTYPNMTNGDVFDDEFVSADVFNATAYYPIKYTLTKGGTAVVNGGTLKDVLDALDSYASVTYPANTDLSTVLGEFNLTWEWEFGEETGVSGKDKEDTLLGDLAADGIAETGSVGKAIKAVNDVEAGTLTAPTAGTGVTAVDGQYNLNANLGLTITVTQVD